MEGTIDQNRLIALLLEEKLINKRQVKDALTEQEKTRKPLSQVLLDLKLVTPGVLSELQARAMGMEHVKIGDLKLDTNVLSLLPKRFALEHRAIPLGLTGNILTVAMERPQDVLAIDEIKMITGYNVRSVVCSPKDIEYGLSQYPTEEASVAISTAPVSATRQILQILIFMIVLVAPLIIIPWLVSFSNEWVNYFLNFDILLYMFLGWIAYAVIIYYIYGTFFEKRNLPRPRKSEME